MLPVFLHREFAVIGVVHLAPLPGSPRAALTFDACLDLAVRDAAAWIDGGVDAVLLENFGDRPFAPTHVAPHVPAFLGVLATEVRRRHGCPVGINCLRNDARSALGAAAASGASFIRVNVLVGATVTDQGVIEGCAADLLRYRRSLGVETAILADVDVKHGVPLFRLPLGDLALTAVERGGADGVIVTGAATGSSPDPAEVRAAKAAVGNRGPVLLGSGARPDNLALLAEHADGVIVGSSCLRDGRAGEPVDPARVTAFMAAVRAVRLSRGRSP